MCVIFRRTGSGVSRGLGLDSGPRSGHVCLSGPLWPWSVAPSGAGGLGVALRTSPLSRHCMTHLITEHDSSYGVLTRAQHRMVRARGPLPIYIAGQD